MITFDNLFKKIRRWLIYKLGGIMTDTLPVELQVKITKHYANLTMDSIAKSLLDNGFTRK